MNEEIKKQESPHSVKFGINAKGLWSAECKVYADNPELAYAQSLMIAERLEKLIKTKNNL